MSIHLSYDYEDYFVAARSVPDKGFPYRCVSLSDLTGNI